MIASAPSGLWVPLFDELADPGVVARIAAEAEEAGWDGFFVWDRLTWPAPVERVGHPWISLAAAATATASLRLGPMVTPLARRRPAKVARESASLDRLSGGRLTLGAGLGSDVYGAELARTGEQVDDRVRAETLDEALAILTAAWSGRPVRHRGAHYVIDDLKFLATPVQRPRVPIWAAGYAGRRGRCAGRRTSTGTSRSSCATPTNSRRSARRPAACAPSPRRLTTSRCPRRPVAIPPHTSLPARAGV